MVLASGRWFGLRADFLCSVFVGLAAAVCIFVSQDAGKGNFGSKIKHIIRESEMYDLIWRLYYTVCSEEKLKVLYNTLFNNTVTPCKIKKPVMALICFPISTYVDCQVNIILSRSCFKTFKLCYIKWYGKKEWRRLYLLKRIRAELLTKTSTKIQLTLKLSDSLPYVHGACFICI